MPWEWWIDLAHLDGRYPIELRSSCVRCTSPCWWMGACWGDALKDGLSILPGLCLANGHPPARLVLLWHRPAG
jgi:hypothetical protein